MFSKFRSKPTDSDRNPDASEVVETPELRQIAALEARVKQLEKKVALLSNKLSRLAETIEEHASKAEITTQEKSGDEIQNDKPDIAGRPIASSFYLYLAAPDADGFFSGHDNSETVGKSLYRLVTKDGMSGCFEMLDSADAVATALISVSQFVKPACRIVGSLPPMPRKIITLEQGSAKKEGETWRVVTKAVVSFE